MNRRIIILLTCLLNTFNIFSQRLEVTGNYLTPGYTINAGYGAAIHKNIRISAGLSYLINNSYKYRGSAINLLDARNEQFIDRFRGFYIRIEEGLISKPKYRLNLMQLVNYQLSNRDRPLASPYGVVGDDQVYLYDRSQEINLYYLEYYMGLSLVTELSSKLQLRTSLGLGINRSPQNIGPDYKIITGQFAQHVGLGLIYNFKED